MASNNITDDTPVQNNTTSNPVENQTSLPLSSKSLNFAITVKLDDENHLLWKSQIMTIIRSHDLEGHITGEITSPCQTLPNQTTKNPAYITWRRHDQTVLNWIFSSLTEGIHAQVIGCETAFAAWDYLEKIFTGLSRARIGQLRLQLQTTKKSGMSMNDYLVKIKRYIDKVAAVDYQVSLEEEVQYILSGLGPKYEAFVTSINNRQGDINMSELRSLALIQESRIKSMNIGSESIQQEFANLAVQGNSHRKNNTFKPFNSGNGREFYQSNSQQQFNQFNRGRGRGNIGGGTFQNNNRPPCQICGKLGHTAIKCYYRMDEYIQASTAFQQGSANIAAMVASS
ncbi:hypothetical protein LWI28_015340 [Acer negundo]|uniref:Gag protein n=1 Tax=Acer negundo TaxID=4023 RepID=A0AAD5NMP8_ACENE|nr:hypothetical protein LWI28_015340 [Acer negundo]